MGKNKFKNKKNKNFQYKDSYIPVGKKSDLERPIEDLNLSEHCYNALKAGGLKTLQDICCQRMSKMYRIQNIGKKDCLEIQNKLKIFNLSFRQEEEKNNISNMQNNSQINNQVQPKLKINFSIFDDKNLAEFINGTREREIVKWEEEILQKLDIIKFCRNGKWGYKNLKGNVLIQPIYDGAFQFSEDIACVEKNGKLGFINKKGEVIIDFIYDGATSFSEGLASVTINDMSGYIDKEGNTIFDFKYRVATPFSDGKALIKQDEKWGVLSKDGSIYWR